MEEAIMNAYKRTRNYRPRLNAFTSSVVNPTREQIRRHVEICLGNIHDPDDVDIDRIAENTFWHFTGVSSFHAEVPEIYYEVIEEVIGEN